MVDGNEQASNLLVIIVMVAVIVSLIFYVTQNREGREVKQYSDSSGNLTEHEVLTSFEVQLQDIVTDTGSSEFKVDKIKKDEFYFVDSVE